MSTTKNNAVVDITDPKIAKNNGLESVDDDNTNNMMFLSRSTLYTPLRAYDQTLVRPYQYLHQYPKIPKSIHEHAVYDFCHDISVHYHQYPSSKQQTPQQQRSRQNCHPMNLLTSNIGLDRKNCSANPNSKDDYTKALESKAITLIGGGFHSTPVATRNRLSFDPVIQNEKRINNIWKQNKRRYHKLWQQHKKRVIKSNLRLSSHDQTRTNEESPCTQHIEFMKELNKKWNQYMTNILFVILENHYQLHQVPKLTSSHSPRKSKNATIITKSSDMNYIQNFDHLRNIMTLPINQLRLERLECIGAEIQIKECPSMKNYINHKGILIGSTSQTWEILFFVEENHAHMRSSPVVSRTNHTENRISESDMSNNSNEPVGCYVQLIPKRSTSVVVLLPIHDDLITQFFETKNLDNILQSKKVLSLTLAENGNQN